MSEFERRYTVLRDRYMAQGCNVLDAMQLAVAQIQYEVRLRGEEYDSTIYY